MKLFVTEKQVNDHGHCYSTEEFDNVKETLKITHPDQKVNLMEVLKAVGIKDTVWILNTQKYIDICEFLADVASLTLPIWRQKYPSDRRPQRCISMIYKYKVGLGWQLRKS